MRFPLIHCSLLILIMLVWVHGAFAHKVTIFAWVQGDMVYTESKISGGKKAVNSTVEVLDAGGKKLLEGKKEFAEAWNFGPNDDGAIPVVQMVQEMQKIWDKIDYQIEQNKNNHHEAGLLKLDCSNARIKLNWKGIWDSRITFAKTAEWYQCYYENQQVITENQLKEYVIDAGKAGLDWTK